MSQRRLDPGPSPLVKTQPMFPEGVLNELATDVRSVAATGGAAKAARAAARATRRTGEIVGRG